MSSSESEPDFSVSENSSNSKGSFVSANSEEISQESSESSLTPDRLKETKKKTQKKTFNRLKYLSDSSDDEAEEQDLTASIQEIKSSPVQSPNVSYCEIPATDDEDEVPVPPSRRSIAAKFMAYESSDDEEKMRKSFYEHETDVEENPEVEENAFSKATRRSILPVKIEAPSDDEDDTEDVIVESDSESEEPQGSPALSSTIRSPLREMSSNIQSISINDSDTEPEVAKKTVSRSYYEQIKSEKEMLEHQKATLDGRRSMLKNLPDGGQKVLAKIEALAEEIKAKQAEIDSMVIDENLSVKNEIQKSFNSTNNSSISFQEVAAPPPKSLQDLVKVTDVKPIFWGKQGLQNFNMQKDSVEGSLQRLLDEINNRPAETEEADPPKYLKVDLMKHQLQAIRFMMWRETMRPRGGILADDMGLGKTLTVISLILKKIQLAEAGEGSDEGSDEDEEEDRDQDEWKARGRKDLKDGGNLIICPASLVKQWEHEISTKVRRGALDHFVFHGPKRPYKARDLIKYDVVITSYQLAVSEFKNNGVLFKVKWDRVVLDEGHVIRNHKSKQSEAMFSLAAKHRWVLTGTPIQNKEFDIYATVKFLRVEPFDDVNIWNRFVTPKNDERAKKRLPMILEALLLRRTKEQLMATGEIMSLPEKKYQEFEVKLNKEERFIYTKVMMYSQAIFANYLEQQMNKNNNHDYDQNKFGKVYRRMASKFQVSHDIKQHEILVLLLRLRQACCHPGLLKSMLEQGVQVGDDEEQPDPDISDVDLLKQIENLKLDEDPDDGSMNQRWSLDNPVFNMDMPSSKIDHLMDVLRDRVLPTDDKAIIVSQWTGYLDVIRGMLEIEGVTYCELNGSVAVKDRNDIVQRFNNQNSGVKIMLLSLTAGGVGLNLVGANYLLLMDLHWNPQLEQQAQDRIYRFGQTKNVNIFKFVCVDTIEEKILKIQRHKMEIATATLTGSKTTGSKLTMNELKDLFNFNEMK